MMKKHILCLTALIVVLPLSGCIGGRGAENGSLDSVHQPIVSSKVMAFDLTTQGGELPPSEEIRLSGWFKAMNLGYGDRVAVDDPSLYGNASASATVARMVGDYGMLMSDSVPVTAGSITPGNIRVVISRRTAHVPGCPDWSSKSSRNISNSTSANYGCATNSNLAAMVADPGDLVKGASQGANDPSSATKPVKVFRDKVPTGSGSLNQVSTGSAAGGGQ